jgi:phosphate uptake regulator
MNTALVRELRETAAEDHTPIRLVAVLLAAVRHIESLADELEELRHRTPPPHILARGIGDG